MANGGETPIKWVPATPFILSANQCYWAVLTVESGAVLYASSFSMPTGPAAAFGRSQSPNGGATWQTPDNATNRRMLIEGTASTTPQPPLALRIAAVGISGTELRLSFSASSGQSYVIESRAELTAGAWTEVPGSRRLGAGDTVQITLPTPPGQSQQFYRVLSVP